MERTTTETRSERVGSSTYIRRIRVAGLFDQFDYDIGLDVETEADPSRLLILYGDNGSGKTTILKLLFHLLHPAPKEGHRSFIARVPFSYLEVQFANQRSVTAQRSIDPARLNMTIRGALAPTTAISWKIEPDTRVSSSVEGLEAENQFLEGLRDLNVPLYFLDDDRTFATTDYRRARRTDTFSQQGALQISLRRAWQRITQQAIRASSKGELDTNAIYVGIARGLAGLAELRDQDSLQETRSKLIEDLNTQAARSRDFARYSFTAAIDVGPIVDAIRNASAASFPSVQAALRPYIDVLDARLNAIQQTRDLVTSFVSALNSFYKNKQVAFDLKTGIGVSARTGASLPPSALSSGERQLLFLFCNLLAGTYENTIFMVDEPELSLNVKWQRQLVKTLLDFTANSGTQFILATHSIELLTPFKNHVVRLETKNK